MVRGTEESLSRLHLVAGSLSAKSHAVRLPEAVAALARRGLGGLRYAGYPLCTTLDPSGKPELLSKLPLDVNREKIADRFIRGPAKELCRLALSLTRHRRPCSTDRPYLQAGEFGVQRYLRQRLAVWLAGGSPNSWNGTRRAPNGSQPSGKRLVRPAATAPVRAPHGRAVRPGGK